MIAGTTSNNGVSTLRFESKEKHIELDSHIQSFMLEDEVDQVLHNLRKSQQCEYRRAEERLLAQKDLIQNLYKQLEKERSDLSRNASHVDFESLLDTALERVEQIKGELNKFNNMKEVEKGFGRTSE
ncbi:hypothetical protein Leryth_013120 [Lithospermum erythrorhizon]|nr:hypothetical protein Leryth_013120 [Lithospermum erythrorhizon]